MQLTDLFTLLNSILPKKVVYSHWEEGKAPALPFICFKEDGTSNFGADGVVYQKVLDVSVELYSKKKDLATEGKIEQAFNDSGIYWDSTEDYIDSEKCFLTTYSISI